MIGWRAVLRDWVRRGRERDRESGKVGVAMSKITAGDRERGTERGE